MIRPRKSLIVMLKALILLSFIFTHLVNAGEVSDKVYTIDESIREALENNWSIKAKEEKIEESVFVKNQARADLLPRFSTTYGRNLYDWAGYVVGDHHIMRTVGHFPLQNNKRRRYRHQGECLCGGGDSYWLSHQNDPISTYPAQYYGSRDYPV